MKWHRNLEKQLSKMGFDVLDNNTYYQWMINKKRKHVAIISVDNTIDIFTYNGNENYPIILKDNITYLYEFATQKNTWSTIKYWISEIFKNILTGSRW